MDMLYTKKDYEDVVRQLRRIWLLILVIAAVCIAVWIVLACNQDKETRIAWPGYVASGVCSAAIVFIYGLFGSRVNAYRRFLRDVDQGLEREASGVVTRIEETPAESSNLQYLNIHLMPDDTSDPTPSERLLRYDPVKSPVPFKEGQRVRLVLFGNYIKGYELL
ncbi:MAG: hypothetical protein GX549_05765 [Clostridiales bacterium]|nr:hypothetical protein [Clostridiales bacterium]